VLADHFLEKICKRERIGIKRLDPAALDFLARHSWPGNIRELEHAIESAIVVSGDQKVLSAHNFNLFKDLDEPGLSSMDLPAGGIDLDRFVAGVEATLLGQALRRSMGNKARAAEMLGIPRTTLISKVKAHQLAS
jgi:DNA-binding NtrC family response regulator